MRLLFLLALIAMALQSCKKEEIKPIKKDLHPIRVHPLTPKDTIQVWHGITE